jgi:hypothetical protein
MTLPNRPTADNHLCRGTRVTLRGSGSCEVGVVTGTGMSYRAGRWVDLIRVNWPLGYMHALQTFEQRGVAWHEVSDLEPFEVTR